MGTDAFLLLEEELDGAEVNARLSDESVRSTNAADGRFPRLSFRPMMKTGSLRTVLEQSVGGDKPGAVQQAQVRARLLAEGVISKAGLADPAMMRLILRARAMWEKVQRREVAGLGELAKQEGVSGSYASRLIRLAFLAPDILRAIMDGRQPAELSAAALLQECRRGLPLDWQQQRETLGFR